MTGSLKNWPRWELSPVIIRICSRRLQGIRTPYSNLFSSCNHLTLPTDFFRRHSRTSHQVVCCKIYYINRYVRESQELTYCRLDRDCRPMFPCCLPRWHDAGRLEVQSVAELLTRGDTKGWSRLWFSKELQGPDGSCRIWWVFQHLFIFFDGPSSCKPWYSRGSCVKLLHAVSRYPALSL